jgi:RNA polymerase sigma factor (sigma-70 family)
MMEPTPTAEAMPAMTQRSHSRPELLKRVLAEARATSSDQSLLQRYIDERDENAFGTILDRHGPMLLGLCRRQLHGSHLAEDVLQATFLVLARKARSIRRRDNLAGWLYGVAQRLGREAQRAEAARRQREQVAAHARAEARGEAGWDDLLRVLDEEMQRLPARYREPLLLCYLEARTQDEAAAHLGWSLSTVRRRLERGRELLRARMVRRGATLGAGLLASLVAPSTVRAVMSAELRQVVLTVAASALQPAAIAPSILMLANGELRMAILTKCVLGSLIALSLAAVLAVSAWSSSDGDPPAPPLAALPQPQVEQRAGDKVKAPAPGIDLWGDPLPKGAVARLGTVELRHGPFGYGLQFTPDGKHLVSLGGGWIRRWDLSTGRADVNIGKDWPIGFSITRDLATADGKLATTCRFVDVPGGVDFACTEYDLATGKARRNYSLAISGVVSRGVSPVLVSPDGKLFAGIAQEIRLWRTSDGSLAHHLQPGEGRFRAMAFSPDGKTFFAGDDVHTIHVFDLTGGTELRSFGIPNIHGVIAMAVAPDGKRLATVGGENSFVRLWNAEKGTLERTIDFPEDGRAHRIQFTPDGRTLIAAIVNERDPSTRAVRTWDAETGQPGRAWTGDASIGLEFAVSADGKVLATMNGAGVIRLWDTATGRERRPQAVSPSGLVAVAFEPDGKSIFTVGDDYHVRQWDLTGRQLRAPRPLVYKGQATFAPGGELVVSYPDERGLMWIRLINAATGQTLVEAVGQEGAVSLDGKLFATSGAERVTQIHDATTGKPLRSLHVPNDPKSSEMRPKVRAFAADGRSLITQGDIVSVWDVATGKQRSSWSLYRNKVLENSEERKAKTKGPGFSPMRSAVRQIRAVAVSADGSQIAFALDWLRNPGLGGGQYVRTARIMIFETMTGKLLHEIELAEEQAFFSRLQFSRDGKLLAAGGVGSVQVWQLDNPKETRRFDGHLGRVDGLAFSADNRRLASASNDSTVLVWELAK